MSFILDALKKLEQKRQHGAVPDLMTVHAPERQDHEKRVIWPYLVLVVLLLNAGILAAVFRPWEDDNIKTAAYIPVQPHVKKNGPASSPPEVKMSASVPDKKPIVPKPSPEAGKHAADIQKAAPVQKHENTPPPVEAKIQGPLKVQETAVNNKQYSDEDKPSALSMNPSPQEVEVLRKKIKEETSAPAVVVTPRKEPAINKAGAVPDEQVTDFDQLPEETRKELPKITISAHIYSNNPRSRIVNINGSTLKEGDEVIRGLKVTEITMSGVILDYQGRRFQVRAF